MIRKITKDNLFSRLNYIHSRLSAKARSASDSILDSFVEIYTKFKILNYAFEDSKLPS